MRCPQGCQGLQCLIAPRAQPCRMCIAVLHWKFMDWSLCLTPVVSSDCPEGCVEAAQGLDGCTCIKASLDTSISQHRSSSSSRTKDSRDTSSRDSPGTEEQATSAAAAAQQGRRKRKGSSQSAPRGPNEQCNTVCFSNIRKRLMAGKTNVVTGQHAHARLANESLPS